MKNTELSLLKVFIYTLRSGSTGAMEEDRETDIKISSYVMF